MTARKYIKGINKNILDLKTGLKIISALSKDTGLLKSIKLFNKYLKSKKCLFRYSANRYLKIKKNIYAVPDMPPINHPDFIKLIAKDIKEENAESILFSIFCISSLCPYKCKYCYNKNVHSKKERLDDKTIENTIESLVKSGIKNIYLSGGEPVLRWETALNIVKKSSNTETGFWLLTTGKNFDDKKAKTISEAGLRGIMVSLDSYDKDYVDEIKSKGAFDNAVNALQLAKRHNLASVIDIVFNKELLKEEQFNKFIAFANMYDVGFINCYAPKGVDDKWGREEFKNLAKLCINNQRNAIHKNSPIAYAPDIWESTRGCMGGKLFFYIDPEGNVKACPFKDESLGNIKNQKIEEILKNKFKSQACETIKLLESDDFQEYLKEINYY